MSDKFTTLACIAQSIINDRTIHVYGLTCFLSASDWLNLSLRIIGVVPGAIYVCFKLYHEYIKKKEEKDDQVES